MERKQGPGEIRRPSKINAEEDGKVIGRIYKRETNDKHRKKHGKRIWMNPRESLKSG